MLQIKDISKHYVVSDELTVRALKNVSVNFRQNEFVSILGPSGCGKTTLLNIIGGLDRYTSGDLIINGTSTKNFKDSDWDNYRNHSIGFVFQSYNLIPHMNILDNVTLSLSVAGASKQERVEKAKIALEKVGLADQIKKRPNQLSGGQMQRVAIARAIVNNPDIILADEPTGALDSETGVQVMELLKEISNDCLVIMVTHNRELADKYSTRIVNLFDGELTSDTNPYGDQEADKDEATLQQLRHQQELELDAQLDAERQKQGKKPLTNKQKQRLKNKKQRKAGMSFWTAFAFSAKHLKSKKGRTFLTSFAGSIGIFGIALVLAISGGMTAYVDNMQAEAVEGSAITIAERTIDINSVVGSVNGLLNGTPYPENTTGVTPYEPITNSYIQNDLSPAYVEYVKNIDSSLVKAFDFTYSVKMNVLHQTADGYVNLQRWSSNSKQIVSNNQLIEDNYDVLYKLDSHQTGFPANYTEVSLVVDRFNKLDTNTLTRLGYSYNAETLAEIPYTDIVGKEYYVVLNDDWYKKEATGTFAEIKADAYQTAVESANTIKLKVVSVLRAKSDESTAWLSSGLAYLPDLSEKIINSAVNSQIGKAQLAENSKNVLTGTPFFATPMATLEQQHVTVLKEIGAYANPTNISIYPVNIDAKQQITAYLDEWNDTHKDDAVVYTDFAELVLGMMSTLIDVTTGVLIAFSAVSLIVSTVMISVITYTSVVERIKEIGILRSIGARKRDISGIFNAETTMIGVFAGILGVGVATLIGLIINAVLTALFGVPNIVQMTFGIAGLMTLLSLALTLIAGLIPARIAANKDPVTCLRTE